MVDHKCTKEPVFTKIFVAQGAIQKDQEAIQKDVSHIRKVVEGNGNPGLMNKMEEVHNYIIAQKQKEESETKIETWSRKKLLFFGGTLAGLGYIIIRIIYDLVKIKILGG